MSLARSSYGLDHRIVPTLDDMSCFNAVYLPGQSRRQHLGRKWCNSCTCAVQGSFNLGLYLVMLAGTGTFLLKWSSGASPEDLGDSYVASVSSCTDELGIGRALIILLA